jgi:CBS domain-containing protein
MKRKHNEKVKNVMSKDLVTANVNTPLSEVANTFNQKNLHHIPVMEGEEMVGIVSLSDILRISYTTDGSEVDFDEKGVSSYLDQTYRLNQIMTKEVVTIKENDLVKDAAKILSSGKFHGLPVFNSDKKLTGMITTTDLAKFVYEI